MGNLKFKIIDSESKIKGGILGALGRQIRSLFQSTQPRVEADVINMVVLALEASPEIQSLRDGKLRLDFGLPDDPTDDIIMAVAQSVKVEYRNIKLSGLSFTNALSVYIQPADFTNLLNSSSAQVVTNKGESIPWLQWLLTAGDSIVVANYHVVYGDNFPTSRTGEALMYHGGVFKVDSAFAGTVEDNFISRALEGKEEEILAAIRRHI